MITPIAPTNLKKEKKNKDLIEGVNEKINYQFSMTYWIGMNYLKFDPIKI